MCSCHDSWLNTREARHTRHSLGHTSHVLPSTCFYCYMFAEEELPSHIWSTISKLRTYVLVCVWIACTMYKDHSKLIFYAYQWNSGSTVQWNQADKHSFLCHCHRWSCRSSSSLHRGEGSLREQIEGEGDNIGQCRRLGRVQNHILE